ncbi:hypothetical protein GALL_522390 [mine drainage metagenome]|uniref:Uncharacterized protein n=1 Tax=mine drainage metagenome TaxID=410659 RepID=A0A1J5P4W7_9ZZZZ
MAIETETLATPVIDTESCAQDGVCRFTNPMMASNAEPRDRLTKAM